MLQYFKSERQRNRIFNPRNYCWTFCHWWCIWYCITVHPNLFPHLHRLPLEMVNWSFLILTTAHGGERVCYPGHWSYLVSFGALSFDQSGGYRPTDRQQDFRQPDHPILIRPTCPPFLLWLNLRCSKQVGTELLTNIFYIFLKAHVQSD